jgi:hypothetical protein
LQGCTGSMRRDTINQCKNSARVMRKDYSRHHVWLSISPYPYWKEEDKRVVS